MTTLVIIVILVTQGRNGPIVSIDRAPANTAYNGFTIRTSARGDIEMTVTIALPDHIQSWIDQQIEAGHFATEEQVIVTALERMADDHRIPPEILDEILAEAIAEADRGDTVPFTEDLMKRLSREAEENMRRGHQVPDDVKY